MAEEEKKNQAQDNEAPNGQNEGSDAPAAKPDRYRGLPDSLADMLRGYEIEYF